MSVIPSAPYAMPPKLIVKTAMEFAAEFYDMIKSTGKYPVSVKQKDYVRQAWPQFLGQAREQLLNMLSGGYPDHVKDEIAAAFIEEREAAAAAAERLANGKKGLIH